MSRSWRGLGVGFAALMVVGAGLWSMRLSPVATASAQAASGTQVATFAAGCFWCVESDFDKVPGVVSTVSGFMGGTTKNPTYQQVSAGGTGHAEVVQVTFDPSQVSYSQLLDAYWHHVDLVDGGGQFCDRGPEYRPIIFTDGPEQQRAAEASKSALEASKRFAQPIAVMIIPASTFTAAEDYHQDYYKKNPVKYKFYRYNCGRDTRLETLWGKDAAGH